MGSQMGSQMGSISGKVPVSSYSPPLSRDPRYGLKWPNPWIWGLCLDMAKMAKSRVWRSYPRYGPKWPISGYVLEMGHIWGPSGEGPNGPYSGVQIPGGAHRGYGCQMGIWCSWRSKWRSQIGSQIGSKYGNAPVSSYSPPLFYRS